MSNTFVTVQSLLAQTCSVPIDSITPDAELNSLGIDSLDLIETLFDAEEKFHIRIPQDIGLDVSKSTVRDVVDIIDGLIEAEGASA